MVNHNFKIGDKIKTVSIPYNKDFKEGIGFKPNAIFTITKINIYNDLIIIFTKEREGYGIRWSETHPNFSLVNDKPIYELW